MNRWPSEVDTLPFDPALPGLEPLRSLAAGESPELRPWPFRPPYRVIKHRPGRRLILKTADEPPAWLKLFGSDRGARLPARHEFLRKEREAGRLVFDVPPAVGYWPRARLLALGHCGGIPVTALLDGQDNGEGQADEGQADERRGGGRDRNQVRKENRSARLADELAVAVMAAAEALASLQRSAFDPGRTWAVEDEARLIEQASTILAANLPWISNSPFGRTLAGALRRVPAAPVVPLHRDFHPGQTLWRPGQRVMAVLDWDDAALGDGLLDAGNYAAHLRLEAYREPDSRTAWRTAEDLFIRHYLGAAPRGSGSEPGERPRRLRLFMAGTLYRLAGLAVERRGDTEESAWLLSESAREVLAAAGA